MEKTIQFNRYLPAEVLYFFLNSFLLPLGLLYTTLLTPVFLIWLYRYPSFRYIWLFFIVSLPFMAVHFLHGVDVVVYLKSYLLLFSVFVFSVCVYQFLKLVKSLGSIYRSLIIINLFLVVVALAVYFVPGLKDVFWYKNFLTKGVNDLYRLKLLTYEASYYSFLLAPIAIYYYLKILLFRKRSGATTFLMVTIPLLLSLSFGVILAIVAAVLLLLCSDLRILSIHRNFARYTLILLVIGFAFLFILLQFFPDNIVFIRIENVFKGRDTSFSGRTFDSVFLGWKIAAQKSIFFGSGPGQTKVLGLELFNEYYNWHFASPDQLVIPNSMGDILAGYGLLGVMLKLSLEVYFFFKSRVYTNYYRLTIFLFVFLYQFTGSFITNIAEYVIWILAFYAPLFPEFDKKSVFNIHKDPGAYMPASLKPAG